MDLILVGIGGFCGAICRFFVVERIGKKVASSYPYGTFAVNLIGAFLLGLLYGSTSNAHLVAMIGTGFLGSLTTFSTFQYEIVQLRRLHQWKTIATYVCASVIAGIGFAVLGYWLGKEIF